MGLSEWPEGFIESIGLHTYHDSSWGTGVYPFGGFAVMHNNGPIIYSSRAMKVIADSTCESETVYASKEHRERDSRSETHL